MKLILLFSLAKILKGLAETTVNDDVSLCVTKIVQNFYTHRTKVTFVDIKFRDGENILKELSLLYHVAIKSRNTVNLKNSESDGYIVAARNLLEFLREFPNLEKEPDWSPKKKFLIIIDNLAQRDLLPIFHTLLKLSIHNAIVIDNARDPVLYTYNPFENYACGKRFDRIIEMGNCLGPLHDIYFYKFVTGLRNCTFRANSAHWPPFSIDPSKKKSPLGVEEFIMQIIGEREQFNIVHYNYSNDAENFSTISENLSAIGPLMAIQERKDDMMFGGMLLTNSRAKAFDFIWVHLPYVDDIRILVKAATDVDPWRNSYLEFSLAVWLILISAFLAYYGVMLLLIRSNDKSILFFKMYDYFFQHGSRIPVNCNIKCVIIFWIWFAFLMSSIYQSSLVGLITNPSKNHQIANEDDIEKFNLKPCVSPLMAKYFISVEKDVVHVDSHGIFDQCDTLLKSIRTVSKSDNLYTYTLYAVYSYYKYNFYDEYGKSEIYAFKNPTNKVIYAIYLYKGFPMTERLQSLFLRLRENGMTTYYLQRLLDEQKNFYFKKPLRKLKVIVPWYILIIGSMIATGVFIIELNRKPNSRR